METVAAASHMLFSVNKKLRVLVAKASGEKAKRFDKQLGRKFEIFN